MKTFPHRVALVTGGLQFGGSTTFLIHLASGLRSAGIACEVFSLAQDNPFSADFAAASIPVHVWNESRFIFEDRMAQMCRAIVRFKPSVVIANIGRDAYETLRYVPEGIARIGVIHDRIMDPHHLVTTYGDFMDHVVVVASHLISDVHAAATAATCSCVLHGIPIPTDMPSRTANLAEPLKLIYFGRLAEGKGSRIFPQMIDALHQRRLPFRWTIHGCGPDESYLRQRLAVEAASGEVVFSTPTTREKLHALVREHDVYVLASEIEGGPLTLLEAMALGLVPICGDIPCMVQEVINAENGFRVPRDKPEAYADALDHLHKNRPLLEKMSRAAQQTITSNFTTAAMAQRYITLFDQIKLPVAPADWPARFEIQSILATPYPWLSLPPFRALRRGLKQIRSVIPL